MSTATADTHETLDTTAIDAGGAASTAPASAPPPADPSRADRTGRQSVAHYDMSDDEIADPFEGEDDGGEVDEPGQAQAPPAKKPDPVKLPEPAAKKPEEKPAKVTERKPATPAADDPFTAELLAEAEHYGISADEARSFGNVTALTRTFAALDRQAAAAARGKPADTSTTTKQPEATAAAPAAAPAPQTKAPAPAADATAGKVGPFEKFKINLNPDEFDEQTISLLNGINDHYDSLVRQQHQELESLKSAVSGFSGVTQNFQQQEASRFTNELDTFFNGLPEDFREDFGQGVANSFTADSPHLKARHNLIQEMSALQIADANLGRPASSYTQLAQRALRVLHSTKLEQVASKKILVKASDRRNQAIERPTGRKGKALSPDRAAADFASNFYRERGLDEDEGNPEI
jgi:hypothetical protein